MPIDRAKAFSVICPDEARQFKNAVEWARKNPGKPVEIFALDVEERDRLQALIVSICGEQAPPENIVVSVRPEDMNAPVLMHMQKVRK